MGFRMIGDSIPDSDNIARYVKPTYAPEGKIETGAFMLKEGEEYLSVNWLECLNCPDREHEIIEIRKIYASKLTVRAKSKIAILNIGNIKGKIFTESIDRRKIDVLHGPEDNDYSHCGIYNLKPDDELIAELIRESILDEYSARG
jgi:hypothetical protein